METEVQSENAVAQALIEKPIKETGIKISLNGVDVHLKIEVAVATIKEQGGVPQAFDLILIKRGQMIPLPDDGTVVIECNQEFIAHAKCGASS